MGGDFKPLLFPLTDNMFSLSDFLELADRLKTAKTEDDKRQHQEALRNLIEADIRRIFDDAEYPNRRRSFGVIRKKLGIFDDSSDHRSAAALRETLYLMGARVHSGEGDDAFWHLPKTTDSTDENVDDKDQPRRPRLSHVYSLLIAGAALVAVLTYFEIKPRDILNLVRETQTRDTCINEANGIWMEIIKCNEKFGEQ